MTSDASTPSPPPAPQASPVKTDSVLLARQLVASYQLAGHVIEGDEAAARSSASPMKRRRVEEGQGAASGKGAQRLEEECMLEVSNERFTIPEVEAHEVASLWSARARRFCSLPG